MKKFILLAIIGFTFGWFSGSILAGEVDYTPVIEELKGDPGSDGMNGSDASIDRNDYQSGSAMAMAMGAHQFDFDTSKTQVSAATAYYQGPAALSLGVAQRRGKALYSGSVATSSGGGNAATAAIGFQF